MFFRVKGAHAPLDSPTMIEYFCSSRLSSSVRPSHLEDGFFETPHGTFSLRVGTRLKSRIDMFRWIFYMGASVFRFRYCSDPKKITTRTWRGEKMKTLEISIRNFEKTSWSQSVSGEDFWNKFPVNAPRTADRLSVRVDLHSLGYDGLNINRRIALKINA